MNNNKQINTTAEGKNSPSAILRKCIACGKIIDRTDLIRILYSAHSDEIIINPNSKQFGKSKYLCPNEECLKLALKKKRLKGLSDLHIAEIKAMIES